MYDLNVATVKTQLTALILAAGQSKRFGQSNKLLSSFGGKALLSQTMDSVVRFAVGKIIVVTGHDEALIRALVEPYEACVVFNEHFTDGMGASIAAGMRAISAQSTGVAICLGDIPFIEARTFDQLVERFASLEDRRRAIVTPCFKKRRGHPVIFGQAHFQALSKLSGDQGGRQIMYRNNDQLIDVGVDDPGIFRDFDTLADFNRA